ALQVLEDRLLAAPLPGGAEAFREKTKAALSEFTGEYRKKSGRWVVARERIATFAGDWGDLRRELARLTLRAAELEPLLKKSGLPCRPEETNPPTSGSELRWAVAFSPFVRSRMNLSDLLFWMGREGLVVLP
nr:hypothetical protein [Syntrophales bacterium]